MDSTTFRSISDTATEYLSVGPFPGGDTIVDLTFVLSSSHIAVATISPAISLTGLAAAADHEAAAALISRSESQINGIGALDLNLPADIPAAFELKLDRGPLPGPTWIVVAVTNTSSDEGGVLNVIATARSLGPEG